MLGKPTYYKDTRQEEEVSNEIDNVEKNTRQEEIDYKNTRQEDEVVALDNVDFAVIDSGSSEKKEIEEKFKPGDGTELEDIQEEIVSYEEAECL